MASDKQPVNTGIGNTKLTGMETKRRSLHLPVDSLGLRRKKYRKKSTKSNDYYMINLIRHFLKIFVRIVLFSNPIFSFKPELLLYQLSTTS